MSFLNWVFGAVVGALVGAAAWVLLQYFTGPHVPTEWGSLLVGLVAGLGAKNTARNSHISFVRGGVAMVAALLAIVGAKYLYAGLMVKEMGNKSVAAVRTPAAPSAEADGDDEVADADEAAVDPDLVEAVGLPENSVTDQILKRPEMSRESLVTNFNVMDLIWFGMSGLIAYQLGKAGRGGMDDDVLDSQADSAPSAGNSDVIE